MPPIIDKEICKSCGVCEDRCPLDVIYMNQEAQMPYIKYPEECWHCGSCRQECPEGAIQIRFPMRMLVSAGLAPY